MLPLGRRVQDKLEALVDKYMFQLGKEYVCAGLSCINDFRCIKTCFIVNFVRGAVGKKRPFSKCQF